MSVLRLKPAQPPPMFHLRKSCTSLRSSLGRSTDMGQKSAPNARGRVCTTRWGGDPRSLLPLLSLASMQHQGIQHNNIKFTETRPTATHRYDPWFRLREIFREMQYMLSKRLVTVSGNEMPCNDTRRNCITSPQN